MSAEIHINEEVNMGRSIYKNKNFRKTMKITRILQNVLRMKDRHEES